MNMSKLRKVPFNQLEQRHLELLAESMITAPEQVRATETLKLLATDAASFYEWDKGVMVLYRMPSGRLSLEAYNGSVFGRTELMEEVKQLAAELECDTIETFVFDPRLASCIERLGGHIESYVVVMPVESKK